jgi:hypothetical protein
MIILEEINSQIVPSALSKRVKETEREFLLRSILIKKFSQVIS